MNKLDLSKDPFAHVHFAHSVENVLFLARNSPLQSSKCQVTRNECKESRIYKNCLQFRRDRIRSVPLKAN